MAGAGDDAVAGDQPPVGEGVRRRQPTRNGHSDEPDDRRPRPRSTPPSHGAVVDRAAGRRRRRRAARQRIGSISALACVRVLKTTLSPSFRSFLSIATRGSCHSMNVSAHARARRRRRRPARPPAAVAPPAGRSGRRRRPGPSSPRRRQVDPDVAAERGAGGGVRRPRAAAASSPPACQASYASRIAASSVDQQVGAVGRSAAGERQRGRRRHRQLLGGHVDVEPDPDHRGRAGRASRPARPGCRRPCGRRQHVVGPLHRRRRSPGAAQRLGDGVPGQQRQPRPAAGRHGRPQQHREGQRGARPGSPRCGRAGRGRRSGARRRRRAPRGARRARVGHERVGRRASGDHLHGVRPSRSTRRRAGPRRGVGGGPGRRSRALPCRSRRERGHSQ